MTKETVMATLATKRQLTHDVFDLVFKTHTPFPFKAGQFVSIKFPSEKPPHFRAYSIACRSYPDARTVQSCIKRIEGGPASSYICSLSEGDTVELKGPSGVFLADQPQVAMYYFITTGTGIAPLKAMIEDTLLNRGDTTTPIFLVFGFRSERDIFYKADFDRLQAQFPNFTYEITLSKPSPEWTGTRGRVTAYLDTHLTDPLSKHYYLCGLGEMVKDVRLSLSELGVPKTQIHYERYT